MAFCYHCGAAIDDSCYCPLCGARQEPPNILNMCGAAAPGGTDGRVARDAKENRIMAALSYLGPLCLVPFFAARQSPFAQYHALRGINLLLLEILYSVFSALIDAALYRISWKLSIVFTAIFSVCALLFFVLAVIGLVNVSRGEARDLPVIGKIRLIRG